MLRFSPAAWRRFADQVRRSLALDLIRACRCLWGHSRVQLCSDDIHGACTFPGHEYGGTVVLCTFLRHWCGGNCRCFGEAGVGVWGRTWNRAVFPGAGGVPGSPPVRFRSGPPCYLFTRSSRAVVFLTSPTCLVEGVRSGTRRRRGASASAQAGGGPGRKRGAQRPHARALRCAAIVRVLTGGSVVHRACPAHHRPPGLRARAARFRVGARLRRLHPAGKGHARRAPLWSRCLRCRDYAGQVRAVGQ